MTTFCPAHGWALRLDVRDASRAAGLRRIPGIRACLINDGFWLRGSTCDESLAQMLAQLPATDRYAVDAKGMATRPDSLLPSTKIPDVGWDTLAACFMLALATPAMPGAAPERHPLRLIRSHTERPSTAVMCRFDEWAHWAHDAPGHRLSRLRFSRTGDEALVLGDPLPPLAGSYCHLLGSVILPAGYEIDSISDAIMLRDIFRLNDGDYALVHASGSEDDHSSATWELIPALAIAPADRASIRATSEGLHRG